MKFPLSLVKFTKNFSDGEISSEALEIVKLSILDWAAVAIKGINEPVSKIVFEAVSQDRGTEESYIFGSNIQLPSRGAALVNGTISHALDYDDTNFLYLGHPSVVINSAVFALANKINLDLRSTIRSVLIGCEVAARVGVWLGRNHYTKGFHITATSGVFGAAMGSASVLNLSKSATSNALNLAISKASGLKVQFGTMGKPYHAGMAASAGVEVAILALNGLEACKNGFDEKNGFGMVYGKDNTLQTRASSPNSFLCSKVSFKFHACCHGTHAAIEALEFLIKNFKFGNQEVKKIIISVHSQYANVCNIQEPRSGLEIKFSYKMIAAMQVFGYDTSRLDVFADELCFNSDLIDFRKKIKVYFNDNLTGSESLVKVKLLSGKSVAKKYNLENINNFSDLQIRVRKKAQSLIGCFAEGKIWTMLQEGKVSSNEFMKFLSECT